MIRLPLDKDRDLAEQVLYVDDNLWVPLCVVNGNVHILPGVPKLFTRMLDGLRPLLVPRLTGDIHRILISTPMAESAVAEYLTGLAQRVKDRNIKVGSYPRWEKARNTVTLVGRDREYMESLVPEVEKAVDGHRISVEGEDDGEDQA